jgi:hypothetical protein
MIPKEMETPTITASAVVRGDVDIEDESRIEVVGRRHDPLPLQPESSMFGLQNS